MVLADKPNKATVEVIKMNGIQINVRKCLSFDDFNKGKSTNLK